MSGKRPDMTAAQFESAFEAAIAWLEWLERHPDDSQAAAACERWCNASPEHRGAFERAKRSWRALGEVAEHPVVAAWRDQARNEGTRRTRSWMAIAAGLLVAVAIGFVLLQYRSGEHSDFSLARTSESSSVNEEVELRVATTGLGERQHLVLSDGTKLTLNTSTHAEIDYRGAERHVRLVAGEAFFDVAQDANRPFVVTAANKQVVALGTEFGVRLEGPALQVTLVEGRVAVKPAGAGESANVSTEAIELQPGQQLIAQREAPAVVRAADVARATSWQNGWIVLKRDTVREAVYEVSRYTRERIIYDDPRIAELHVSGTFRTGEVEDFLNALTQVHPIRIERPRSGEARLVWRE